MTEEGTGATDVRTTVTDVVVYARLLDGRHPVRCPCGRVYRASALPLRMRVRTAAGAEHDVSTPILGMDRRDWEKRTEGLHPRSSHHRDEWHVLTIYDDPCQHYDRCRAHL